jgi:hypothetical protein
MQEVSEMYVKHERSRSALKAKEMYTARAEVTRLENCHKGPTRLRIQAIALVPPQRPYCEHLS